ncbi:MAG: sugar O-acetyltransferase [Bifidobacterium scardovii]|uniref:sugar O-acetyltransferase n=1 Tax=Bifidobacterium scardovii TaxID=158787 RepID=UPI0006671C07|nr:sugar O-acetyltransferase [Bifidobacterium scardovii]MBS6947397.1 sugar O-acetyltransferase [Bifidobacterium scardovii]MDU3735983.1 sugar O-acetyltransferase [Bifidobacterium scardovii]MDU5296462.1 sugar O-acetyltransferase [Bifidobacterium scardovii]MDU5610878.1 sugar O-acetyltransferase [Bifidobacterium scardovii]MDU5886352.1 sugar O-acetyltransferase [Bifidobacterium scardovii]
MAELTNAERRTEQLPYHYDDPNIMDGQLECQEKLYEFNRTHPTDAEGKQRLLKAMFAEIGEGCHVETPAHANWGFAHVHMGKGIYCNVNFTCVDDADITIGDYCMFGPNVVIATAGHPVLPVLREHHYVYCIPVTIGRNVWVGANVSILPGVTIGDNCVIGAGSVVTHSIPANSVAYGAPCEAVREIGDKDREYFYKDRKLDVWE